jgi:hypothetical protein
MLPKIKGLLILALIMFLITGLVGLSAGKETTKKVISLREGPVTTPFSPALLDSWQ